MSSVKKGDIHEIRSSKKCKKQHTHTPQTNKYTMRDKERKRMLIIIREHGKMMKRGKENDIMELVFNIYMRTQIYTYNR
jgi:hypothetical protein